MGMYGNLKRRWFGMLKILNSSSKGNCYIIETSTENLIIECGVAYKNIKNALNENKNTVGCLISHHHL